MTTGGIRYVRVTANFFPRSFLTHHSQIPRTFRPRHDRLRRRGHPHRPHHPVLVRSYNLSRAITATATRRSRRPSSGMPSYRSSYSCTAKRSWRPPRPMPDVLPASRVSRPSWRSGYSFRMRAWVWMWWACSALRPGCCRAGALKSRCGRKADSLVKGYYYRVLVLYHSH